LIDSHLDLIKVTISVMVVYAIVLYRHAAVLMVLRIVVDLDKLPLDITSTSSELLENKYCSTER